ncbi:2-deoxy-D-gluconate 3-dehydrogenase [Edaphobacter acidisoli]|uniref:2-deoxy-D-gluconate 3-dehydrogenase n=1 Tax=Edaphobacter acidisoli TaxID=2040573 RepID=A0A916RS89_9BACT|nr:SDR family oxidoreductase [Edaphobacter acidisoli]GGA68670.1 2-deoxy-D-gluconate 3-dehydrogenase [Edaphobacter acidisoli]
MTACLNGKTAVVIGGTQGIGRAIALGLSGAGAGVVASSRSAQSVEQMAQDLEAYGAATLRIVSDVADRSSLEALHDAVIAAFGKVDILVNCAGMTSRVPTLECSEETWDRIMDVNLTGTLRACQIFGKSMLERGYGRIINIASLSTFVAFHEVAAYGASKAAVAALTRSLAVEWSSSGVSVNAIAPGIFPTDLNRKIIESPRGKELLLRSPMRRFGAVEEVVGAAVYFASDESSYTTGQIIVVDGGQLASGVNQ